MGRKQNIVEDAAQRLAAEGATGFAARTAYARHGDAPQQETEPGQMRKALKRVGRGQTAGRGSAGGGEETTRPRANRGGTRRGDRSAQAALGMLGDEPGDPLGRLSPEDLERLARLVATAKTERAKTGEASSGLDQLSDRLAARGVNLNVTGNRNTVTISLGDTRQEGGSQSRGSGWSGQRSQNKWNSFNRGNWGRQMARVKNFLDRG